MPVDRIGATIVLTMHDSVGSARSRLEMPQSKFNLIEEEVIHMSNFLQAEIYDIRTIFRRTFKLRPHAGLIETGALGDEKKIFNFFKFRMIIEKCLLRRRSNRDEERSEKL